MREKARELRLPGLRWGRLRQNPHTVTSDCNRVTVHRLVILLTAMSGPEPSARTTADPRTVRLALELLERTAGPTETMRSASHAHGNTTLRDTACGLLPSSRQCARLACIESQALIHPSRD